MALWSPSRRAAGPATVDPPFLEPEADPPTATGVFPADDYGDAIDSPPTRSLCAAVHLSNPLTDLVLSRTIRERHRAWAPCYSVNLPAVLQHALDSRRRRRTRDGVLLLLLVGTPAAVLVDMGLRFGDHVALLIAVLVVGAAVGGRSAGGRRCGSGGATNRSPSGGCSGCCGGRSARSRARWRWPYWSPSWRPARSCSSGAARRCPGRTCWCSPAASSSPGSPSSPTWRSAWRRRRPCSTGRTARSIWPGRCRGGFWTAPAALSPRMSSFMEKCARRTRSSARETGSAAFPSSSTSPAARTAATATGRLPSLSTSPRCTVSCGRRPPA